MECNRCKFNRLKQKLQPGWTITLVAGKPILFRDSPGVFVYAHRKGLDISLLDEDARQSFQVAWYLHLPVVCVCKGEAPTIRGRKNIGDDIL